MRVDNMFISNGDIGMEDASIICIKIEQFVCDLRDPAEREIDVVQEDYLLLA